jgi:hypothetical protein
VVKRIKDVSLREIGEYRSLGRYPDGSSHESDR